MDVPVLGLGGALVLGAASSLHCIVMCGPLGCAASGTEPEHRGRRVVAYQAGRVAAYTTLGALLGGFGGVIGRVVRIDLRAAVPWLMIGALLMAVLPAGARFLPQSTRLQALLRRVSAPLRALSPNVRALVIGLMTPLLPCGVLYSIFPAVIASQHASTGALIMGAFALGSAPSLLLAQLPLVTLGPRRSASFESWRVVIPLVAAGILIVRTIATTRGGSCH
jgi:sulfite exporter TauE/SafE